MFKRLIVPAVASLLALSPLLLAGAAHAQVGADLNISPKRVVFDQGERSATVYIFNQGDREATYTVELVDRVMLPSGEIVAAADRADIAFNSATDFVQYTPRRITLAPRASQAIRVRARPAGQGQGEYRTHLTVTALPAETTGFTAEQAAATGDEGLSIQVVALFSISIPVILREGAVDAHAGIENLTVVPSSETGGRPALSLDLVRLGANSVYGDVEVHAGQGASDRLVAAVRGVAVYPETPRRTVLIPLPDTVARGEPVRIVYRDDDVNKGAELATATLLAP